MFNYAAYDEEKCDFYAVAEVSDLPNGERLFLEIDDTPIIIFNIADEFYAIKDQCSHEDLEIGDGELEGYEVTCAYHGAHFDVRNGKATTLPAVEDVPAYPVRVRDGMIELGVLKDLE